MSAAIDSDVSAPTHTTVPPSDEEVNIVDASSPSPSLSPSDSGTSVSSSSESTSEDKAWAPTGAYVPVHRRARARARAGSDTSATSINTNMSNSIKLANSTSRPGIQVYTRDELLALAPSSLIHASLHPVVTPALIAKHPRILRTRGDGIARALDMSRIDSTPSSSYANASVSPSLRSSANATTNYGLRDATHLAHFASSEAASKACGRVEFGSRLRTPMQVQTSSAPTRSLPPSLEASPALVSSARLANNDAQLSVQGGRQQQHSSRRRRRRAAYQRNFAQQPAHTHSDDAKLSLDFNSTAQFVTTPASTMPIATTAAQTPQTQTQTQTKVLQTAVVPMPTRFRRRRQLDVTVLESWRAPPTAVAA